MRTLHRRMMESYGGETDDERKEAERDSAYLSGPPVPSARQRFIEGVKRYRRTRRDDEC